MAVAQNPKYRNTRELYYTDKFPDSQGLGTIIQVLKSTQNSFDHSKIPAVVPGVGGTTAYTEITGDAEPEDNPDYQYPGFLYCDGSEYYIHDYPGLYEAIGNEYGGTASDGIDVVSSNTGWGATVTATIDAPPSGANQVFSGITPVQATCSVIVDNGEITGIEVLNPGKGYDPEDIPDITFSSSSTGTVTYNIRINSENGQIQAINSTNVWQYWPETSMGTFKVPDLKAKRVVGNGPVYGTNTPNVGNSELGVGINTIDGNWYMDKNTQKNQFALGNITTTNYSDVVETVGASIIGAQVISVTLQEKKLSGAPQHSHFLLHSEAPQDTPSPNAVSGDRYVVSYKPSTGKVNNFLPPGGIAYNHTHVLSKAPILDGSVGTYDIFNWSGGDQNSGSIKEAGYYYASGGAGAGSFVEITDYGTPTNKKFSSQSLIGGRTITTDGVPIYDSTTLNYANPGTYSPSVPSDVDQATITLIGGGGSGAVYSNDGNNGGFSRVDIGSSGSRLRLTCGGGGKGGAASVNEGGAGGAVGSNTKTGTYANDTNNVTIIQDGTSTGNGGDGGDGQYWNANLIAAQLDPTDVPSGAEGTAGTAGTGGDGTKGRTRNITNKVDVTTNFTYGGGNNQLWELQPTNSNYYVEKLVFELAGGGGRDCGNFGGNGCTNGQGEGGAGKYMKIRIGNPSPGTNYRIQPGQSGRTWNGQASAYHSGKGGIAGEGYGGNNGGGGGAATLLRLQSGNTIIAGAGGGGGGGAYGEGVCGQNGQSAGQPGDSVIETSQDLESGTGATGGRYGCTGGGGGGGGGGCARSTDTAGGNPGAGGGGSGGHEQGYGGKRGLSAVNTNYISDVISSSNNNTGNGYANAIVTEDRGYWTSGGGGGGAGGLYTVVVKAPVLSGLSNISVTVGEGGAGVSQGGVSSATASDGYAQVKWQVITGYEGGTESISVGDVFIDGSGTQDNGVNFYASGTGSSSSNGFKLPTTQVPTVVFEGGGGGSGATATATVSGNKITDLDLTNPGSGYTQAPRVRILGGAGVNNYATVSFDPDNGQLENLQLVTSEVPTTYLKFGGTQQNRYVTTDTIDAEDFYRLSVKVARGNGNNGGDTPEESLSLYYNTDESLNFPSSQFIGTLVPVPTTTQLNNNYDGDGSGNNATNWYTYEIVLPEASKTDATRFQIRQSRGAPSGANDNAGNTDNYGLLELTFENKLQTNLTFVASEGKMAVANDVQQYSVDGDNTATYVSGIFANDLTITLSSATPIVPTAVLDPDQVVPLIEPYMLVKYLIKAF